MNQPSLKEIIHARDECARIIAKYGEKYLPIFERLENEIAKYEEKNRLFEKALRIGTQNGTQSGTQSGHQFSKHQNYSCIFNDLQEFKKESGDR